VNSGEFLSGLRFSLDEQSVQWTLDQGIFTYRDFAVGAGGVCVVTGTTAGELNLSRFSDSSAESSQRLQKIRVIVL
jgi:glutamate dehydrogenase/leucine dehydrogenase